MEKKPVKKKSVVKKKAVNTVSKKPIKTETKLKLKHKIAKHYSNFKQNKLMLIGIVVLIVLILGVLITTTILDKKTVNPPKTETIPIVVSPPVDVNLTEEQLQEKAAALQLKISTDIINTQKAVFENWYSELGLDKAQMDACYTENDFTNESLNIEDAKHLSKLIEDYQLAQAFGISGTPGLFVNSYKVGGYTTYDNLKKLITIALEDQDEIVFDLNGGDYVADSTKNPTLVIISNQEQEISNVIIDEYLNGLKEGPYADFFNGLFSEVIVEKIDYRTEKAKNILETTKAFMLPLFFFEGDINSTEFSKSETFSQAFQPVANGYVLLLPEQQNLNYKYLEQENDYIIGNENAPVTLYLFTDYDCPYCTQFDNESLDGLKQEYIDAGLVRLIVKDFVTHQNTALVPAIFSRCAQDQGKYYETHRKLFENNSLFGGSSLESLYAKYDAEIKELEAEYKKANPETTE